jgi:hypothetical protein
MGLLAWTDTRRAYLRGYNAMDLIHEAIYEGRPVGRRLGTAAQDFLRAQQEASSYLNLLQSMVDTVVARIGKRRAMPVIGCDNAAYREKLNAQLASHVLRRKMGRPAVERMLPLVLRDSVVRGDGFVEGYRNGNDVALERFARSELVFDDGEARNGDWPRTAVRVKLVDRDVLCAMYPEARKRIAKVTPAARDIWSPYDWDAPIDPDQVELVRGWHLPTSPGADDGRYVVAIRDGEEPLKEKVWTRARYPFARVQWTPPMRGFMGIGLPQQLAGSQHKVNELWEDHQVALHWASMLIIFQPRGSNVDKHHLRGRDPRVVPFDGGQTPIYEAPDPASKQAMDSLRWLIQQMYEIAGISQAAASSKNPLGPNASGKAQDTFYDIVSERFAQLELQYAMVRVDCGQVLLDEAKDLAEDAKTDKEIDLAPWIKEIDWTEFDWDGGNHHLNLEPENFIPDTRAGKLDTLSDMAKIPGLLHDPLVTASLLDEPDLSRANRRLLGPNRMLEKLMDRLGTSKNYQIECVPTPHIMAFAAQAKEACLSEMNNAYAEGAEDDELAPYRWFLAMLDAQEKAMAPPPMPSAGAPGLGPMPGALPGQPMPPPPGGPPGIPFVGPQGGPMQVPDPMNGATSQLAAGMSPFVGAQA